jgi:hypothetical protein
LTSALTVTVGFAALIAMTGCGKDSTADKSSQDDLHQVNATKTEDPKNEAVDNLTEPPGPLHAFRNSPEEELIQKNGEWTYVNTCMKKEGMESNMEKPTLDSIKLPDQYTDIDWGIISLQSAKENGYRNGPKPDREPPNDGKEYFMDTWGRFTPAPQYSDEEKARNSVSQKCLSQYGDAKDAYAGFMTNDEGAEEGGIHMTAQAQAKTDPRVLEATQKWSACMKEAGYDFATPKDAASFVWDNKSQYDDPDEKEKKTAVKDFECKKSTNLMTVWYDVLHEKESGLIDQHRPVLEKSRNQANRRVEFAQKVIANNGTSLDIK